VLMNLVGNAVKFTEHGTITVRVARGPAGHDGLELLRFSVVDTGIGIPPDKLEAVFEAFTQADGSTTRKYGGTGLGLTICRQLLDLMRGRIWVESVPLRGCAFHFELPLPVRQKTAEAATEPPGGTDGLQEGASAPGPDVGQPLQVLVADDNPVNRTITRHLLERRGLAPTFATNGIEALDLVQTRRFDLVLMDLQMPNVDGFEATMLIRAYERTAGAPRVPIVALTAHAMPQDRQRCFDAGMDGYLAKPLRSSDLFAEIERVLRINPSRVSGLVDRHEKATA